MSQVERIIAVCDELAEHPLALPWFLTGERAPQETRTLLGAVTAVVAALCQDRDNRGYPLPSGLEGLVENALLAWSVEASERDRVEAAYAVALGTLGEPETFATLPPSGRRPASSGRRPTS